MSVINPKSCCQVAVVVRNMEKAAADFAELFGVPVPAFDCIPEPEIAHVTFNGVETPTRCRLCCFDMGQLVFELIEIDEHDCCYKEVLGDKDIVFHHVGFKVESMEKAVDFFNGKGCPIRQTGKYPGGEYAVPDSIDKYGVYFNIKYDPE